MSSMTAALGVAQMGKLEKAIALRRKVADSLSAGLSKGGRLVTPTEPKGFRHTYQMYSVRVKGGSKVRDGLRDHLSQKGIVAKVYFEPIHLTKFYGTMPGTKGLRLPVTEKTSEQVLTLPIYPTMTPAEVAYLLGCVSEFFAGQP
jgi:dTDP-4-amino-4,6-dideoxygalactose transaminase